jgi:hypothetical protein
MMKSETAPDGKVTPSIYTGYTRCKIYDPDSTYYTVQLHSVGDDMMIIAHEMGRYHWDGKTYTESGRSMPLKVVNDSTFISTFRGYQELMVRSTTMTEERKQEIRDLVKKYPHDGDAPVKHFVLSTTERKLNTENRLFLYIIIIMGIVAVGVAVYVYRLRKRKREVERKLAEIEEEHTLRPEVVADAMRQVESEFFQSDYYIALRRHIEQGHNIKPSEWKELEQRLKVVYLFAYAYELYRKTELVFNRKHNAASRGAVKLCKNNARNFGYLFELPRLIYGILSRGRVKDEKHLSVRIRKLPVNNPVYL